MKYIFSNFRLNNPNVAGTRNSLLISVPQQTFPTFRWIIVHNISHMIQKLIEYFWPWQRTIKFSHCLLNQTIPWHFEPSKYYFIFRLDKDNRLKSLVFNWKQIEFKNLLSAADMLRIRSIISNTYLKSTKQVFERGVCRQYPKVWRPSISVNTKENNWTASVEISHGNANSAMLLSSFCKLNT